MLPAPWLTGPYMIAMTVKNVLAFLSPEQPLQKSILCGMAISFSTILVSVLVLWSSKQEEWLRFLLIALAIVEIIVSALTLTDALSLEVRKACALTFIAVDGLLVAATALSWMIKRQVKQYEISRYQHK